MISMERIKIQNCVFPQTQTKKRKKESRNITNGFLNPAIIKKKRNVNIQIAIYLLLFCLFISFHEELDILDLGNELHVFLI